MSNKKMTEFYAPYGGTERILASGRQLSEGERFELTDEEMKDPFNKRLIDEMHILKVPVKKEG